MTNDGARPARKGLSILFMPLALLFDHVRNQLRGPATFLSNRRAASHAAARQDRGVPQHYAFEEAVRSDGTEPAAPAGVEQVSSKECLAPLE